MCDLSAGSLDSRLTQNVSRAGFKGNKIHCGQYAHNLCADMHLNIHQDECMEMDTNMRMDTFTGVCINMHADMCIDMCMVMHEGMLYVYALSGTTICAQHAYGHVY